MIGVYTVLVNPVSGNGRSLKVLPEIEKVLREFKLPYHIEHTASPGDAERIAREAVSAREEGVVVVGGDGTVFESLAGLINSALTLIYAPCGTGNDFVKCIGLPVKNTAAAVKKQLNALCRKLDYGLINGIPFMNICGAGFDVEVLRKLGQYRARFRGLKAYLFALKDALREYKPLECEISVDGGPFVRKVLCILSIGNGQYFGGGMKAVPAGVPYDGELNLVEVNAVKKWQIPFLLPLFISGSHTKLSLTRTNRCKRVQIRAKDITFQMDGELRNMQEADIQVVPSGLNVRY